MLRLQCGIDKCIAVSDDYFRCFYFLVILLCEAKGNILWFCLCQVLQSKAKLMGWKVTEGKFGTGGALASAFVCRFQPITSV
ncbi:hypothetical protein A3844_12685 [Paenibacillus helianthi]|uniref:Uncharacterized protein n=1 Tax=Paenibacillus helianthi TaxID=1349432 RepID=A0ABX3EPS9_9BACL|nr:hypothetical protein A3842_10110 [Paenibacillus sp. P3E]OKP86852.1 hypothetical protein A3844_12685 [Paenibacillus helianthi]